MEFSEPNPLTLKAIDKAIRPVLNTLVRRVSYETDVTLWQVLQAHPQLVHVMNHGPVFGPWPAAAYLAKKAVDAGGGDRTPFGMFHRLFFQVPGVRDVVARAFNSRQAYSFDEVLALMRQGTYSDFLLVPEGDNCNFGELHKLRPFRSHRYVELAIRLGIPILITVHRGTEGWATQTHLDRFGAWVAQKIMPPAYAWVAKERVLNIPALPSPMPHFGIKITLHTPTISAEDLSPHPPERSVQVFEQSMLVRNKMNQMLADLDKQVKAHRLVSNP